MTQRRKKAAADRAICRDGDEPVRRLGTIFPRSGAITIDRRRNDVENTKEALVRTPDGITSLLCACPSTGASMPWRFQRKLNPVVNAGMALAWRQACCRSSQKSRDHRPLISGRKIWCLVTTTKPMMAAEKAFGEVHRHAEKIRNDGDHQVEMMDVGEMWAQGDVGLVRLAGVPTGSVIIDEPSAQLAPGATQGSRHILSTLDGVRLFKLADPTPLDGPIIDAPGGCTVEHPEHGDVTLPAGVYGVVYQRAFADELRRVED